ncbi:hypothetical protein B7463_g8684, partial [Scytalidium lignicola]
MAVAMDPAQPGATPLSQTTADLENGTMIDVNTPSTLSKTEKEESIHDVDGQDIAEGFPADDPRNPYSWSTKRRVLHSLAATVAYFSLILGNAIYVPSVSFVVEKFHVGPTLSVLPITLYSLGFVFGPAVGTAFTELYGRQYFFKGALLLAMVFTIVAGNATTFRTLCIARFFAGAFGSPITGIFGGVLNDMWDIPRESLGTQMTVIYGAISVIAPFIAPLVGGAIIQDTGNWRWTFHLEAIMLGFSFLCNLFTPETYRPILLAKYYPDRPRAHRITIKDAIRIGFGRPFNMLLRDSINLPTCVLGGFYQAVLYVYYVAYPILFESTYHFSVYHTGLTFLGLMVGAILGITLLGVLDKRVYLPKKIKAEAQGLQVPPEERLLPGIIGSVLFPIALFWLAWTGRSSIHWAAPTMSGVLFGIAFIPCSVSLPLYKNEVYGASFGASAFAADTAVRFLLSATFPLFTEQMIRKLKFEWAISLLAFLSLLCIPCFLFVYKFGARMRETSLYKPGTTQVV